MAKVYSWLPFFIITILATWVAQAEDASLDAGIFDATSVSTVADSAADGADAGESLEGRAQRLRKELDIFVRLNDGKLPREGYIEDHFAFDLADEKVVDMAKKDLKELIIQWENELASLGEIVDAGLDVAVDVAADAGVIDAAVGDAISEDFSADSGQSEPVTQAMVIALELDVAKAKLAFLRLPVEERRSLQAQDAERKRVAVEQERANEERENAMAEQRRAETARQKALNEAEKARDELERIVANEQARIEGVKSAHAVYRRELAERRQGWATEASGEQVRVQALLERIEEVAPKSEEADALYGDVVSELLTLRRGMRAKLVAYQRVPSAPRYVSDSGYESFRSKIPEKQRKELENSVRSLSDSASDLESQSRSLAWDTLAAAVAREEALNSRRIDLLDLVTPKKRSALLGLGMEGIAQLERELERVELEALWFRAHGEVRIRSLTGLVKNPVWIGQATWSALLLAILIGSVTYVRRKGPAALERLRVWLVRSVRRPTYARPLTALIDALVAILAPLALLLGVVLAKHLFDDSVTLIELALPLRLLLWYASYRLFIVASHRLLNRFIQKTDGRTKSSSASSMLRSDRLAKSVRMVARYAFGVAIILILASEILGRGYLYHLVLRFAWFGAIPIFAVIVRSWRSDIADAYLAHRSEGRLASLVRSSRQRWFGFFVASAAFLAVLGQAAIRAIRRFILGFEQTRKALAFLFRRRLEKQAAESLEAPEEGHLPERLRRWYSEEPVSDEAFVLKDIPGFGAFEEEKERWSRGEMAAPLLIVGETGFGKTSWLNIANHADRSVEIDRLVLNERLLEEGQLLQFLVESLGLDVGDKPSRDDFVVAMGKRKRSIVMLDDAHHLFLRGVGTFSAWNALVDVVERTRDTVFWILTMGEFAYQHLAWARGGVHPFHRIIELEPWSEERVALLINSRTEESGYEMDYDDLVVDKLEGVEGEAQLVSTQEGYSRLIWDYADGCPRVALYCWKNSLLPDKEKRVRVRLFRRPDVNALEALSETEKFVLASVVWHVSLTLQEAVTSLNMGMEPCSKGLTKLHDMEILEEREGRYRVLTRWLCPVTRYLRRKHLIELG